MNGQAAAGGPRSPGAMPPWTVLVVGALGTFVCLVLLWVPIVSGQLPLGLILQAWVRELIGDWAPSVLVRLVDDQFVLLTAAVLGLLLVLLPGNAARKAAPALRRAAAARTTPGPAPARKRAPRQKPAPPQPPLRTPDGRLEDLRRPGRSTVTRTVGELRRMAGSAGIPWRAQFETEGGARGLLEVLHALDPARSTGPDEDFSAPAERMPAPVDPLADHPGTSAEEERDRSAMTVPPPLDIVPSSATETEQPAPTGQSDPVGAPSAGGSSWTSDVGSSVYTSTSLYSSERLPGTGSDEDRDRGTEP